MKKILALILTAMIAVFGCVAFTGCSVEESKLKVVDVKLTSEDYAFGVKKGNTELKNKVNEFFKAKKTEVDAIISKYTLATQEELSTFGDDTIKTKSTDKDNELVVATNLEFNPFEYTNGKKIAGIDMEIAQKLADYLGKTLVVVHMDFTAVVPSVAEKSEYDIAIAGLTITEDRKESLDFTDTYFNAAQMLVVKADDTTFDGLTTVEEVEEKLASLKADAAKCGGQKGTTSQFYIEGNEDMEFAGFENLTFKSYSGAQLAAQDMLNGNISFVVVDYMTANALVKSM